MHLFANVVVTSMLQNIAKQRDVRRWSNLNCAFRIVLIGMGDFKRCAANSPLCLGLTDFCSCDSDDVVAETNIPVKRKHAYGTCPFEARLFILGLTSVVCHILSCFR